MRLWPIAAGFGLLLLIGGSVLLIGLGGIQGTAFASPGCEWQPVMNGSYSSIDEYRSDFQGDFSEYRSQVDFRTRNGVLEFSVENQELCEETVT